MQKQIDVQDLEVGMYISQLDRPWLETPFLFQGFFLETDSDIADVQRICEYVFIDVVKGKDTDKVLSPNKVLTTLPKPEPTRVYINTTALEQEIVTAKEIRYAAKGCIEEVFETITQDKKLDIPKIKKVVSSLVDSIVRNPNAIICLTQLKNRDEYTAQHSINVCILTVTIGRHLGMAENSLNLIGMGALLHDIGKMKTPLEILNKPDRLTDEEFRIMKSHPEQGRKILEEAGGIPDSVIDIAFSHHERLAGHGYPRGIPTDQISPWSKIVAIVDVYDAITSDRCYHDGMSPTQALTKMYEWRIRDFDPELLEQFIQCIGIYPIGTLVELTSGEVGLVISVNTELRLKPKVLLILDEKKNPYYPTRIIDVSTMTQDMNINNYGIKTVLEPKSFNIDVKEYIADIQHAQHVNLGQKVSEKSE